MKKYINKRNIALILLLVTLFTYIQLPKNIVYGDISYNGQTSIGNYTIGTTAQLDLLAQKVNSGTLYEGSTFILTNNITYDSSIINNYIPIGNSTYKFSGIFDGNGFYIGGINIYFDGTSGDINSYKGIFGYINNASIKNMGLVNSTITGLNYIGGITGYANNSTIDNCYNKAELLSKNISGGITSYSYNTIIKNCYNNGIIKGSTAGGIVGNVTGTDVLLSVITNCRNTATITSTGNASGILVTGLRTKVELCTNSGQINGGSKSAGIAGLITYSTIYYCTNYADITSDNNISGVINESERNIILGCSNYGNMVGASVGGVICTSNYDTTAYCANYGNITGWMYVAGIAASLMRGNVYSSYNTGNITGTDNYYSQATASGIVGVNNYTGGTTYIFNSYNTGNINSLIENNKFGISGIRTNGNNSYYLNTIGVIKGSPKDAGVDFSRTLEYMKSNDFLNLLNNDVASFQTQYKIDSPFVKSTTKNSGYPIFWYQLTVENITIDGLSTVNKGDTTILKAIITPENAPNKVITWTTSDSSIADIIPVGKGNSVIVQGIRKGTVTITVKAQDGSGVTASKTINVVSNFTSSEANYILVDDVINYITAWKDTENDPLYKEEYRYIHTPNNFNGVVVDNTMGYVDYNNTWTTSKYTHFSKVGTYKIQYRVQDNPNTANTLEFENYRYYSDYVENTIYVHRKPIATYAILNEVITDNSYDSDHSISYANKGIIEWEWTCVSNTGVVNKYTVANKNSGVNSVNDWINTYKTVGYKIILRVKDNEGAWSEPCIKGANEYSKPIANFTIEKNPMDLYKDTQTVTDMSCDTNGLEIYYSWCVYKDNATIINNHNTKEISSLLNLEIKEHGVGTYTIRMAVWNSAGILSDVVAKTFEVVVYNDSPTVNFNLVSNENPVWTFPKTLGLYILKYRPLNTLFLEEYARFDTYVTDPNIDNTGFTYNWKLERFAVKDIGNISGTATNTYNYITQFPFVNSFKNQGLSWGAYRITLKVSDKPPIPPYVSTDSKTTEITKYYYIVPETSLIGSFQSSKSEVMVGDTITLKATSSKLVDSVDCIFNNKTYSLSKSSEDGSFIYWKKEIVIPDNIESGTYNLQFIGKTTYGGNGNVTREVKDNASIDIIALKLINFRITNIVNHTDITFPYTKDMLISNLIPYKTGYYVTFQIDSKGKPDDVYGRIDIGNNVTIEQNITLTKVVTGDTETWQGRFYTTSLLPSNTVISIKTDCIKGTTTYNYNEKENWDGKSLIIKGSALQDGRINLTN